MANSLFRPDIISFQFSRSTRQQTRLSCSSPTLFWCLALNSNFGCRTVMLLLWLNTDKWLGLASLPLTDESQDSSWTFHGSAFLPKILISKVILASTAQIGPVYPHSTEKPLLWRTVTPASLPSSTANTKLKERGWELGNFFSSKKRKQLPDSTLIALVFHNKHPNLWLQSVLQHPTKWWGSAGWRRGGRLVSPQIHNPRSCTFSGLSSNPHAAAVNRKSPLNSWHICAPWVTS